VDAVGGFGFAQGGVNDGAVSIVRATLKALPESGTAKPDAASRPRKPKAKPTSKRAKSRNRPTPAVRKTAKPEIAAPAGAAG
jgi:hypothetical protein